MAGHPTLRIILFATAAALLLTAATRTLAANPPDLAQLKRAAESGDAAAQLDYGARLSNQKEQFAWYLRAAEQGYASAQDAVGSHYESVYLFDAKKRPASIHEAVRWTSRAAYQGLPAAQMRLSKFFETGAGVGRDPVIACMWMQLALDNPHATFGERMMANMKRDRLIAHTSPENIAEGERLAGEFTYPKSGQLNPIEVRLLVDGLTLAELYRRNENASVTVNRQFFTIGESKEVNVDDHSVALTCLAIATRSARFKVGGTDSQITLELRK